jgi:hypothetical protein
VIDASIRWTMAAGQSAQEFRAGPASQDVEIAAMITCVDSQRWLVHALGSRASVMTMI